MLSHAQSGTRMVQPVKETPTAPSRTRQRLSCLGTRFTGGLVADEAPCGRFEARAVLHDGALSIAAAAAAVAAAAPAGGRVVPGFIAYALEGYVVLEGVVREEVSVGFLLSVLLETLDEMRLKGDLAVASKDAYARLSGGHFGEHYGRRPYTCKTCGAGPSNLDYLALLVCRKGPIGVRLGRIRRSTSRSTKFDDVHFCGATDVTRGCRTKLGRSLRSHGRPGSMRPSAVQRAPPPRWQGLRRQRKQARLRKWDSQRKAPTGLG